MILLFVVIFVGEDNVKSLFLFVAKEGDVRDIM